MSESAEIFLYWQNWIMCIVFNYALFCLVLGRVITVSPAQVESDETDPYALLYPELHR